MASVYALLSEFPGAKQVANVILPRLTNLLSKASKGRYGKDNSYYIQRCCKNLYRLKYACKIIRIETYHQAYPGTDL